MKKTIATMLTVLLAMTSLSTLGFAQNSDSADTHVSDTPSIDADAFFSSAKVIQSDENAVVLQDTETLDSNLNPFDGSIDKVSTTIAFLAKDPSDSQELLALATTKSSGGNQYRYLWDKTGTVKLHTRVYYTETQTNGSTYVALTKVVGGFDAGGTGGASVGSGVSVTLNKRTVKQFGKGSSNTARDYSSTKTYDNSIRSWTYTAPTSWKAVEDCQASLVGCTYSVKLKRADSTWLTTLSNQVV